MRKNRIDIENWRPHGADENYIHMGVFAANDSMTSMREIQNEVDEHFDWDSEDCDSEMDEDWEHVIYCNNSLIINDGAILEHNGRKFRISITEVSQ